MARQIKFNKDEILNIAFEMVREEDIQMVTARKLAAKALIIISPDNLIFSFMICS
jgi:hypothetical protein